jgi:hypothetical protein
LKDDKISRFDDKKKAKDIKEENNGIIREITGSDSGVDCGIIKPNQNYSCTISSLKILMDELSLIQQMMMMMMTL